MSSKPDEIADFEPTHQNFRIAKSYKLSGMPTADAFQPEARSNTAVRFRCEGAEFTKLAFGAFEHQIPGADRHILRPSRVNQPAPLCDVSRRRKK
jgi:hypothetical protein